MPICCSDELISKFRNLIKNIKDDAYDNAIY